MTENLKISVVGGGVVGKAVAAFYKNVKIFDKYKDSDSIKEVADADFIFIAVPTPHHPEFGYDLSEMEDAFENLSKNLTRPSEQAVIIKSTVTPGTTANFQKKYPDVNIFFNPEFLTENVAIEDFAKPDKQLVGYTEKSKNISEAVMNILPQAPYQKIAPAEICEMVKLSINSYYAFKVIYGNQLYDFAQKIGANYDVVREGLVADTRIVDSHFDVFHGDFRGYGGKCLPKDIQTTVWLGRKNNVNTSFLEEIIKVNNELMERKKDV